jgi:hypothetical protein
MVSWSLLAANGQFATHEEMTRSTLDGDPFDDHEVCQRIGELISRYAFAANDDHAKRRKHRR